MDRKLSAELERLLSELADEGATRQSVERIESLMLGNPDLQDHYWSWMDNHVILGMDRDAILGDDRSVSPVVSVEHQTTSRSVLPRRVSQSRRYAHWRVAGTLAVSACLLGVLLPGLLSWRHAVDSLWGSNDEKTWQIPRITRVAWEGPYFADREQNLRAGSQADVGLVSLGFVNGLPANGYVLRLEPGTLAELMMAADAHAENNLSVTELNTTGTPVRRSVSFNNFGANGSSAFGNEPFRGRRYGLIGTWSEYNDTDKPKYYLINGIHKSADPDLPPPRPEQEFRLSRMVVTLDEPDLILLGWDDSGIEPSEENVGIEPDGDYDDISVAIRLSGKKSIQSELPDKDFRLAATPPSANVALQTDGANRYRFTLEPGEIAFLKVASEAEKSNAAYLVLEGSDEILWSAESTPPGKMNLGAAAIQNTTERSLHFAIMGENSFGIRNSGAEWRCSTIVTVHTQPGCTILGFEDDPETSDDFDDIRITLLTMSPNGSTPFESR